MKGKGHDWQLFEESRGCWQWICSNCGMNEDDPLATLRCAKFEILVYLRRRIAQFKKNMFYRAGTFLLKFSK